MHCAPRTVPSSLPHIVPPLCDKLRHASVRACVCVCFWICPACCCPCSPVIDSETRCAGVAWRVSFRFVSFRFVLFCFVSYEDGPLSASSLRLSFISHAAMKGCGAVRLVRGGLSQISGMQDERRQHIDSRRESRPPPLHHPCTLCPYRTVSQCMSDV
jgi:hypothetical protein